MCQAAFRGLRSIPVNCFLKTVTKGNLCTKSEVSACPRNIQTTFHLTIRKRLIPPDIAFVAHELREKLNQRFDGGGCPYPEIDLFAALIPVCAKHNRFCV